MRTTLTLDEDVARLVKEATHRERRSTKDIINDALRRALGSEGVRPYHVIVHDSVLRPGIDQLQLNQLADDAEDDAAIAKLRA